MFNIVDLVTPFDFENNIDYESLLKIIKTILESKVDGIVILGNGSEVFSLNEEEVVELLNFVLSFVDNRVKVYVGLSGNVNEVLEFDKINKNRKIEGYILKNVLGNDTGIIKYFTHLADNLSFPIMIEDKGEYNLDLIQKASYHPNIIGIVVNTNEYLRLIEIANLVKNRCDILITNHCLILPSINLGLKGIITVSGNGFSDVLSEICQTENISDKRDIYFNYKQLFEAIEEEMDPIGIKYFMKLKGICEDKVRLPLGDCSKVLKRKIEEHYYNLQIIK